MHIYIYSPEPFWLKLRTPGWVLFFVLFVDGGISHYRMPWPCSSTALRQAGSSLRRPELRRTRRPAAGDDQQWHEQKKKMISLDLAFAVVRHITQESCDVLASQLSSMLAAPDGKVGLGRAPGVGIDENAMQCQKE